MHGVQAKAKAIPNTGGAQAPKIEGRTWNRRSPANGRGNRHPGGHDHQHGPEDHDGMPDTRSSDRWWVRNSRPRAEADAPRMVKTTVKPAMKASIPRTRWPRSRRRSSGVRP